MLGVRELFWLFLVVGGLSLIGDTALAETTNKKKKSKRRTEPSTLQANVQDRDPDRPRNSRKSRKKPDGVLGHKGEWSAGLGAGTWGHTGLAFQKSQFGAGSLNLGVGFSVGSLLLHGDWIFHLDDSWTVIDLEAKQKPPRGEIVPWAGVGGQVGLGAAVRFPVGFQYTMVGDPINFFGSAVLQMGQAFATVPRVTLGGNFSIWLGVQVGVRVLL